MTDDFDPRISLRSFSAGLIAALLLLPGWQGAAYAAEQGSFQRVETETLDEEDFVFPDDLSGGKLNIVMVAVSAERENGEWQGDQLLEWYAALDKAGVLSDDVKAYHFSVMKVPFFVKGLVRGGIADDYAGKVPADQAGVIFVKDVAKFAATPGIELDGQPTIVLVAADGTILETFKGVVSDATVCQVTQAVEKYCDCEPVVSTTEPDAASVAE